MTKQLLLLGAALAHVHLLAHLGQHPLPGVQVTLITPHPRLISKDMLAGFVAGQHALDDCVIPLEPRVRQSGARLACDVPIMATEPCAPAWLAGSGLALDAHGFIAVDACQRATRHANVFATGPVAAQADRLGGCVTSAARAASTLAASLASVMAGLTPAVHQPSTLQRHLHTLRLLSCGDGHAIASWDGYGAKGRWVGWLKSCMDRRLIAKYREL